MRRVLSTSALVLALAAGGAEAEGRSYGGEEVEAIRCAYLFGFGSAAMHDAGYISAEETSMMMLWSALILDRYVSGTNDEKLRAMEVVAGRRSLLGSLVEFGELGESCFRRFPIG